MDEPSDRVDSLARAVIGAAIEVHRRLGPGYLESIYEHALAIELERRQIPFERQLTIDVLYLDRLVGEHRLDFLVDGQLVVELKAIASIDKIHVSQVVSYLKAGNFELGLLINFNVPLLRLGLHRVVST